MPRRFLPLALLLGACGPSGGGSPTCGIALLAGPTLIQQQLYNARAIITDAPRGLPATLPARVVGQAPAEAIVAYDEQHKIVMGYHGPALPAAAYGLLVVDDTSQRAIGVLVYESAEPKEYPRIGVLGGGAGQALLNLYGVRVDWASVSNPRCPLLGPPAPPAS